MSSETPHAIRLRLARGHWSLGERAEALDCLERAVHNDGITAEAEKLIDRFRREAPAELWPRLYALEADRGDDPDPAETESGEIHTPLKATGTLAELFADQGLRSQALEAARVVLRRDPDDARARAVRDRLEAGLDRSRGVVRELERWLQNARWAQENPIEQQEGCRA